MKWKVLVIAAVLKAQFPVTEAQSFGLLDPKLCYLLDGILFLYGVIVTALYLRAKFSRGEDVPVSPQAHTQLYNELNIGRREEYDVLDKRRGRDPEMGGKQVGTRVWAPAAGASQRPPALQPDPPRRAGGGATCCCPFSSSTVCCLLRHEGPPVLERSTPAPVPRPHPPRSSRCPLHTMGYHGPPQAPGRKTWYRSPHREGQESGFRLPLGSYGPVWARVPLSVRGEQVHTAGWYRAASI
uniref:T-cell surface glycoprotein CD3 zeta chain n=1 Tax=Oryctolagus cuniculus TaxID=9986 RepID=A0A5F9C1U8_RABIT